ncbi:MAG TPA: OmpA family protein [Candidatus Limnocylindrales bacterium]|nr:OmpA family protein [Candidatus Limnocylindrales bacterium]
MRNWCVTLVVGALLAVPLCAQQKDAATEGRTNESADSSVTVNAPASDFLFAPAAPTSFAMPAAPTPKPADIFSDWENNAWNRHAWGQLTPRYEVAGLFQYVNFCPCSSPGFNNFGFAGSFTYNASKWLGLTAEMGAYRFKRNIYGPPVVTGTGTTYPLEQLVGHFETYLFGPRLNLRRFDHFVPFAEVLFGATHAGPALTGDTAQSTFAMAAGGGVDVVLSQKLTWRFAEMDYLMTNFTGSLVNPQGRQNNFRIGTGIVYRWDYPPAPPKPNHPPVAACSANPTSVYQGTTDPVAIHVAASDPDNDPLTFTYSTTGGSVDGTGPDVRWSPANLALGTYTVNVKVDDGRGGSATCAADIAITKRPNRPPVISCAPERSPIIAGERVAIKSNASDPDGDPITYSYSAAGGQVSGSGASAQFDSTGLAPGNYTVTCTADDGQGGRTSASTTVGVKEPPVIKELEAKLSLRDVYFPTAQPTVAKPDGGLLASQQKILDTLASDFKQYLTYKPAAHLILEGHADIRGGKDYNLKLSQRRVDRARNYLVEHGVAADHLETRASGDTKNLTAEEVKALINQDATLDEATRQKILKNLPTIVLANNRRVDITLSTTGQQGVRGLPFNAEDAATLISRSSAKEAKKPAAKPAGKPAAKPAPKTTPKP